MTKAVLMSIKPKWAEQILSGKKIWEYRRQPPPMKPQYDVLLYASSPVQAIVGEFTCDAVANDSIDTILWYTGVIERGSHTPKEGKEELEQHLREYFDGKETCHALHVGGYEKYEQQIPIDKPPQNFKYVDKGDYIQ